MTREHAKSLVNTKLHTPNTIFLGDGDRIQIEVNDDNVERLAKIVIPILEREEKEKGA